MKTTIPSLIYASLLVTGANASVITTLGAQHFTDGSQVATGQLLTADAGEPAPFNGAFIGSDIFGPNFAAMWTFTYTPQVNIGSATLTIGIDDQDSAAAGNQVAAFTVNGLDLTALLNTAFEGHGGATGEYDVYTVTLPAATFNGLSSGTATVALTLQAPGLGVLGATAFNGAALDFSTLNIVTAAAVPEPGPAVLLLSGLILVALGLLRRPGALARANGSKYR